MGDPPGGPQDRVPPVLLATVPESTEAIPSFKGNAEFRFNEVVSEGTSPNFGLGSGDLEKLVVLSPTKHVPVVRWHRSRIVVRPREGWRPNRVYRVELLPGMVDLRNNRSKSGTVITFTTGAPIPTLYLKGRVVDWSTQRALPLGLVEAVVEQDSLVYRTAADSAGFFTFGPLPPGPFLVYGVLDQNRNHKRDPREAFDSVRVAQGQDSVGEVWAFKHDSIPSRIQTLTVNDSVSIAVTFTQQLNPYQRLPQDSVRVRALPDSTDLAVEAILPKAAFDSAFAKKPEARSDSLRPRADSAAAPDSLARPDTVARPPVAPPPARARRRGPVQDTTALLPLKTKPALFDLLIIRLAEPLAPEGRYLVEVNGVENVSRVPGRAVLGLERKPPPKPVTDTSKVKADSAQAKPDTTRPARPPGHPPA